MIPPESIDAGIDDWKNQVGTGPFMMTDYVKGSQAVYDKNPDYWGKATIQGKEYQLPFIDRLVFPVIVDESTQIAALRTGKLDLHVRVPLRYKDTLSNTCPDLIQYKYLKGNGRDLALGLTAAPWNDKNVRRALMIGTDLKTIRDVIYEEGDINSFQVGAGVPCHVPMEELPASCQELFEYDPIKAKQMLADAGYPDGFSMVINQLADPEESDIIGLLIPMYAELGIIVDVNVQDQSALNAISEPGLYQDSIMDEGTIINPATALNRGIPGQSMNNSGYDNPTFTDLYWEGMETVDAVERTAILKEAYIEFLDDVSLIPFANPYTLDCYWPWVQNYYGETECGYYNYIPMIRTLWIDQDMKKDMGF